MSNPIVYFEIAGPDAARLRSFFKGVFGWEVDDSSTIAPRFTGGLRGGIREDPPDKVLYMGVDDIDAVLARVEANGGSVVVPRTTVPDVVTFALFKDPAGNLFGIAENGTFPTWQRQATASTPSQAGRAVGRMTVLKGCVSRRSWRSTRLRTLRPVAKPAMRSLPVSQERSCPWRPG